ncbi:hypothetical protein M153_351000294 [Pseudoloma neurophilia]|uniref:Alpha/beta hydrolase n=1 Tax=Pseudoloma neurophilia TaxID=146866 RepID=A0A0R0LYC4_9MICR|nr:hypothetical protein M153_351000294 [Pseudoloma neurophilia]
MWITNYNEFGQIVFPVVKSAFKIILDLRSLAIILCVAFFFRFKENLMKKIVKRIFLFEIISRFRNGLICYFKIQFDKRLNTKHLVLYPKKLASRTKIQTETTHIDDLLGQQNTNEDINTVNDSEQSNIEHIILFKPFKASIHSVSEIFKLDERAINHNLVFHIPEYKKEYFESNIDIPFHENVLLFQNIELDHGVGPISDESVLKSENEKNDIPVEIKEVHLSNFASHNHQNEIHTKFTDKMKSYEKTKLSKTQFDHLANVVKNIAIDIYIKYKKRPHLVGFSLGCGMLLHSLMADNMIALFDKIILMAPFKSSMSYVEHSWFLKMTLSQTVQKYFRFDNEMALKKLLKSQKCKNFEQELDAAKPFVQKPDIKSDQTTHKQLKDRIIIFHGVNDNLFPIDYIRYLSKEYDIELREYSSNHNGLMHNPDVWKDISCTIRGMP